MRIDHLVALAPTLRIETERLVLRKLRSKDAAGLVAQETDREVMRWIRDPQPVAQAEERAAKLTGVYGGEDDEWLGLAVVVKERGDDRMVGIVVCRCATFVNRTMEVGWRFETGAQGLGFGVEAVRGLIGWLVTEVGVRKVVALCAEGNRRSWGLMEKVGMRLEGRLREYSWLGGEWVDERVYGVLASEVIHR